MGGEGRGGEGARAGGGGGGARAHAGQDEAGGSGRPHECDHVAQSYSGHRNCQTVKARVHAGAGRPARACSAGATWLAAALVAFMLVRCMARAWPVRAAGLLMHHLLRWRWRMQQRPLVLAPAGRFILR